jgi:hypothetical protein
MLELALCPGCANLTAHKLLFETLVVPPLVTKGPSAGSYLLEPTIQCRRSHWTRMSAMVALLGCLSPSQGPESRNLT